MADTTYTPSRQITAQTRVRAYQLLADLLVHLPQLGVDLVSIVRNQDNTVSITLTGPVTASQLEHLGLT